MQSKELFLLDTFIDNNNLILCFIDCEGNTLFFSYRFTPVVYIQCSRSFIKNFSARFKLSFFSCEMKDIYLNKNIRVYGINIPVQHFFNTVNFLINRENIKVYNTDLSPVIQFHFKYNLFPLAKVAIEFNDTTLFSITSKDNAMETDYIIPPLSIVAMSPVCNGSPRHSAWEGITVSANNETVFFDNIYCKDFFEAIADIFTQYNPDMIITDYGDPVIIPLLEHGSKKFNVNIKLSRPRETLKVTRKKAGTFFSYGRVVFRDSISYLKGRIHIDVNNSFFVKHSGIDGLIEVARLTSMPLQDAARLSPGSAISIMELRTAFENGYLIPSEKAHPERFKRATELIKLDKGGIFFLPPVGIFENVAEVDFFSMYPSIIKKFNISVETLNCKCCSDMSHPVKVPGTNYRFCRKRKGIIPETIEPLIEKRKVYKACSNELFNNRQNAIKWILVTCFGYLGYKNAKFGCVEAHEATTAAGRDVLLKAKDIAEAEGFELIYAVTDSLYLSKKGAKREHYERIVEKITLKTGFKLNLEGIYKFIKFLPSAENNKKQVMNKFFGVFENNEIKVRGLMMRRRDTPEFIKEFQSKLIKAYSNKEDVEKIYKEFLSMLEAREVETARLSIRKRITKKPEEYKNKNLNAIIASSIPGISPGESIEYVVTDNSSKIPEERASLKQNAEFYDVKFYSDMLKKAYNEVVDENFSKR